MSLDVVLLFWEAYFIDGDINLILFVCVAVLIHYKEILLKID